MFAFGPLDELEDQLLVHGCEGTFARHTAIVVAPARYDWVEYADYRLYITNSEEYFLDLSQNPGDIVRMWPYVSPVSRLAFGLLRRSHGIVAYPETQEFESRALFRLS